MSLIGTKGPQQNNKSSPRLKLYGQLTLANMDAVSARGATHSQPQDLSETIL